MQKRKSKLGEAYPFVYLVPRSMGSCRKALQDFRYAAKNQEKIRVEMKLLHEGHYIFYISLTPDQRTRNDTGLAFIKGELESWGSHTTRVKFKFYRRNIMYVFSLSLVAMTIGITICSLLTDTEDSLAIKLVSLGLFNSIFWIPAAYIEISLWQTRRQVASMIKDTLFNAPEMPESVSYPEV